MAPVFASLPLGGYLGWTRLNRCYRWRAQRSDRSRFPVEFRHDDVREFVRESGEDFDLVHAALVLHHLSDDAKGDFLAELRPRVRPGGCFIWADVFREPGESREQYAQRYATRIRRG